MDAGRRPARRGRGEGRARARGGRGRGARPGDPGDRGPGRPVRHRRCRSTPGGPRWPGPPTRPGRWWATTSAGSPTPTTWPAAADAGATVVATHIRLGPRIPDPEPVYDDVVDDGARPSCSSGPSGRSAAGLPPDRIVLDAGLDLGKTADAVAHPAAGLGPAGRPRLPAAAVGLQQDVPRRGPRPRDRRAPGGVAGRHRARAPPSGCRVMRVHDVGAHRQACDVLAAIGRARRPVSDARRPTATGAPARLPGQGAPTRRWWPRRPTPWSSSWWPAGTRR